MNIVLIFTIIMETSSLIIIFCCLKLSIFAYAGAQVGNKSSDTLGKHNKIICDQFNCIIGIDKMVEVKNILEKVNDWQSLGLQLGLLYPTLEQIEIDNRSQVEQCKTKMIAAWLKRKDNVLQVGAPSWSVLKAALKRIGENAVVEEIVT